MMPTPLMKSFAKQTDKKPKTVEKLWKKAERLVKKKYEIDEDSSRFYPLVVGVLKNFLGIEKEEDVNEDEGGGVDVAGADGPVTYPMGTVTSNMGDYVYAAKIGTPAQRMINGQPLPVAIEIKPKRKTNKKYHKSIRKIKECLDYEGMDIDDAISDMIKYYCEGDSVDPVDDAINALSRFFGIVPTIFDDIK